jgi:choline dehydrogenase-like flavoprotein
MYGAHHFRLRQRDFEQLEHRDGISPAWPLRYSDFEPWYQRAEEMYHVHGLRGEDPTDPPSSAAYPHPPISHEPRIQKLADDLRSAGLHPFHAPSGVMLDEGNMPSAAAGAATTAMDSPAWSTPRVTLRSAVYALPLLPAPGCRC